jgi:hypothetical protein
MLPPVSYNEYKFKVTNENLHLVKTLLDSFYGGSDSFPEGVVDSIYYDTAERTLFEQCAGGDLMKSKFRIRGYGESFNQMHLKGKDMYGVSKLKNPIIPVSMDGNHIPSWYDLQSKNNKAGELVNFDKIQMLASHFGELLPSIRVRYYRYRYRINDYRMTLDTNIEVMGFSDGRDSISDYGILPNHVLEIKTVDSRPRLPLLGITKLPQISFSKFFLGLNLLESGDSA